jgi:hypothetical protein
MYMVRPYTVKKIRVQFSIRFNLVGKLVCNFMLLDNNSYMIYIIRKEKGQSLIYKTFPSQRAMHFFTGSKNQIFIFWTLKNISSFPSNFYHKFLVENCRAGLMIFLNLFV